MLMWFSPRTNPISLPYVMPAARFNPRNGRLHTHRQTDMSRDITKKYAWEQTPRIDRQTIQQTQTQDHQRVLVDIPVKPVKG